MTTQSNRFQPCTGWVRTALLLSFLLLPGCSWLAVGGAVGGAVASRLPVGTRAREEGPRVIAETGQGWRREVLNESGRPFEPSTYQDGQLVRARWIVPLQIGTPVDAVVAVSEPTCEVAARLSPSRWELRPVGREGAGEELWRVASDELRSRILTPGRRTLGYQLADRLSREAGLSSGGKPAWLLIAPRSGAYEMILEWEGNRAQEVLSARPCIRAWVEVPLAVAVSLTETAGGGVVTEGGGGVPATRGAPNTSDAGVSLRPGERSEVAPVPASPSGSPGSVATTDSLRARYGLLGVAEYDLSRIHQVAISWDLQAETGEEVEQRDARALQEVRSRLLQALLSQGQGGQVKLCTLVRYQGLGARPSRLWNGEPTIPRSVADKCPRPGS